jgi:hypothetical protein
MSESTIQAPASQPKLPFDLQDGETIIQLCRRHWVYLWPAIGLQALFAIVPLIVGAFLIDLVGLDGTPEQVVWGLLVLHALYRVVRAFLFWYRYNNDIWVITNQRLIDSFRKNPFSLAISSADLVNVQDISVNRTGVLRTTLDYGDIVCQTAGAVQAFRLIGIPNPRAVQVLVDKERDRERTRTR